MYKIKKWFTIVELIVVITIIVFLIWFWFMKISDFFSYNDTLTNIDKINKTIIDNKISSNFYNIQNIIYFDKQFNWFYYLYNDSFENNNSFFINSMYLENNSVYFNLSSDNIFSSNKNIVLDNWDEIKIENVLFNWSWSTDKILSINKEKIDSTFIYIKDLNGSIITWNIKIVSNSYKNDLILSNIIWINFANLEEKYDKLEIINWKNWKSLIYWFNSNIKNQVKKAKLSFIDKKDNFWYLDIN